MRIFSGRVPAGSGKGRDITTSCSMQPTAQDHRTAIQAMPPPLCSSSGPVWLACLCCYHLLEVPHCVVLVALDADLQAHTSARAAVTALWLSLASPSPLSLQKGLLADSITPAPITAGSTAACAYWKCTRPTRHSPSCPAGRSAPLQSSRQAAAGASPPPIQANTPEGACRKAVTVRHKATSEGWRWRWRWRRRRQHGWHVES
jgi:hypothetical protein